MVKRSTIRYVPALLALVAALLTNSGRASAYSARVHIALANELHAALLKSGDGTIALRGSPFAVQLPIVDADAIVNNLTAFRAGAIGPDNTVFPGLTDLSHAAGVDPYGQCQLLYDEAFTQRERAYALGCFLHGASDAVAHHYVNFLSGETFTLSPLEDGRTFGYINMARHIVAESMIQDAIFALEPASFSAAALEHDIPRDYVLRSYFSTGSVLWQRMSEPARTRLQAAQAMAPGASLAEVVPTAGLAAAETIGLLPLFIDSLQASRADIRAFVDSEISALQADSELGVTAGADGALGTPDDQTSCSTTCPTKAIKYNVYINMITPRQDAGGRTLPPALDVIVNKLGDDLNRFLPAFVETIELASAKLNGELTAAGGLDSLDEAALDEVMAPSRLWLDRATAIDYQAIKVAAMPAWLITFTEGLGLDLTSFIANIFQPYIDQVRAIVLDAVLNQAKTFLQDFLVVYEAERGGISASNLSTLSNAADPALGGTTLDFVLDSGLWSHSFNLVAATLANHKVMVVAGDTIETGPASYDASYTMAWTQAGTCDYLRDAIFPFGDTVASLLTVSTDRVYPASLAADSPVECHDGSLMAFGEASVANCDFTSLADLVLDNAHRGSISRAYPPEFAATPPTCAGITVPGLPEPPPGVGDSDAGVGTDAGDGGGSGANGDGGGCCSTSSGQGAAGSLLLVGMMGLVLLGRSREQGWHATLAGSRQRWRVFLMVVASVLLVSGCGSDAGGNSTVDANGDGDGDGDGDAGGADAYVGPDLSGELLDALGTSVWTALDTRDEHYGPVERSYELHFRADTLQWAELRNPYGPARRRTMRSFTVQPDGRTVRSIVKSPDAWPPHPDNGLREEWSLQVIDGSPRQLRVTDAGGETWTLQEGSVAVPSAGLTATVRAFDTSANSPYIAFCDNLGYGITDNQTDPKRQLIWRFARGQSDEGLLGQDRTTAAAIGSWTGDPWSVTDLLGFRPPQDGGGAELFASHNFVVRYTGVIPGYAGGEIGFRELNDSIEDAFWIFLGGQTGSTDPDQLFMEVHNYASSNRTDCARSIIDPFDECFGSYGAGDLPVEIIVIRCTEQLEDPMTLQLSLNSGSSWGDLADASFAPELGDAVFPPVF